ncbi:MAG: SDR family NAD(P)-dependent oxidoreductase [Bacteroidota bacterium]
MKKTILLTGATDGIGLETANMLVAKGHHVLLHGRNQAKLSELTSRLAAMGPGTVESYLADLSSLAKVDRLAQEIAEQHAQLDVIINNAGVYQAPVVRTAEGLDIRFAVNTLAPYVLTKQLSPLLPDGGRVVNLSSAAQAPVSLKALKGGPSLSHGAAYAQSKLAITSWTRLFAQNHPHILAVSVNPGSYLGSKMVKEAFGMEGREISIGADIVSRAALSPEFEGHAGEYYDNDAGRFGPPHPEALDAEKSRQLMQTMEALLINLLPGA